MIKKVKILEEEYGAMLRTLFSVFISPVLMLVCSFFITQTYNDIKDLKAGQVAMSISNAEQSKDIETLKKGFEKGQSNDQLMIKEVGEKVDENSDEILAIWKFQVK